jgi:hypothetical protein
MLSHNRNVRFAAQPCSSGLQLNRANRSRLSRLMLGAFIRVVYSQTGRDALMEIPRSRLEPFQQLTTVLQPEGQDVNDLPLAFDLPLGL